MCVAVSALKDVDVSGGGGSVRLLRSNYGTSSVYNPTLRLWAVPVLGVKLFNLGEIYGLPPLQFESCPIFVACMRVAFDRQRWKREEVVAQQWGMSYVVQFYVHPSVVSAKNYGKFTVTAMELAPPFARPRGRLISVDGKTVGVWRHVVCCRTIGVILHDLLA